MVSDINYNKQCMNLSMSLTLGKKLNEILNSQEPILVSLFESLNFEGSVKFHQEQFQQTLTQVLEKDHKAYVDTENQPIVFVEGDDQDQQQQEGEDPNQEEEAQNEESKQEDGEDDDGEDEGEGNEEEEDDQEGYYNQYGQDASEQDEDGEDA